jgi:hypothetical protein
MNNGAQAGNPKALNIDRQPVHTFDAVEDGLAQGGMRVNGEH